MIVRNGPRSLKRGRLLKPMFRGYLLHITHDVLARCTRACVTCHARRLGAVHTGLCYMSRTTSRRSAHGPVLHVTHDVSVVHTGLCYMSRTTSRRSAHGPVLHVTHDVSAVHTGLCYMSRHQRARDKG